ncbi:hypothetical protein [Ruegeria sp. MALMAid1280]|uniref:hypothetical protein n=1 Tax=Ruegeria sp. MALMAid1280 TaxID=3411634 RepID=UPI003BA070AA
MAELQQAIQSATQTVALLSKARCVRFYDQKPDSKFKTLYPWPNEQGRNIELSSFAASRGLPVNTSLRVKSLFVSYNAYQKLKKIHLPEVDRMRVSRALLDVMQIVEGSKKISGVTAVWDMAEYPERAVPQSLLDTAGLEEFSKHSDSMFMFDRYDANESVKLRPVALPALLKAMPEIKELVVAQADRREFSGEAVDKKSRSGRRVVHQGNKDYLQKVLKHTNDAVRRLVGDCEWSHDLRRAMSDL